MVRNTDGIWINTSLFRERALHFEKHGYYCPYEPSGDPYSDYYKFWKEEARRCREGYSVGGARITGHHYAYLNYSPIKKSKSKKGTKAARRVLGFPDFWDGDYDYFWLLDIARWGMPLEDYLALNLGITIKTEDLKGGKNIIVGKARRKGFSYKNGAIAANIYKQVPRSSVIIGAFQSSFLYPKGTMGMVSDYINFYNKHTAWSRMKVTDRENFKKEGYKEIIDGKEIEGGYLSSIEALSFGDNPDAARGRESELFLFEEAGKWPTLEKAYMSTKKTLEDGDLQ